MLFRSPATTTTTILFFNWTVHMFTLLTLFVTVLKVNFPGRSIGRERPISWPFRSPDLIPLNFLLWDYVKEHMYYSQRENCGWIQSTDHFSGCNCYKGQVTARLARSGLYAELQMALTLRRFWSNNVSTCVYNNCFNLRIKCCKQYPQYGHSCWCFRHINTILPTIQLLYAQKRKVTIKDKKRRESKQDSEGRVDPMLKHYASVSVGILKFWMWFASSLFKHVRNVLFINLTVIPSIQFSYYIMRHRQKKLSRAKKGYSF
jgi:hypothetical protein